MNKSANWFLAVCVVFFSFFAFKGHTASPNEYGCRLENGVYDCQKKSCSEGYIDNQIKFQLDDHISRNARTAIGLKKIKKSDFDQILRFKGCLVDRDKDSGLLIYQWKNVKNSNIKLIAVQGKFNANGELFNWKGIYD